MSESMGNYPPPIPTPFRPYEYSGKNSVKSKTRVSNYFTKLFPIVCEAISVLTTEDKQWTTNHKVRKYIDTYFDISEKFLDNHFLICLKEMEKQKIIMRKSLTLTFYYKKVIDEKPKQRKRRKKDAEHADHQKNLGPDVVITRSGRVSIIHKDEDENIVTY
ncbi:hypothetical protein TRFO_19897 [Tritrichomonas foetus]|uniref:Uncharacterized protein n=1 Tax=Tritrichomonas foetus TaxID=1144522 RepID=A0A1J4KIK1_9EUKA|nr:hypothetical protein TRFO_19897 [Tritrichomonas foetus]|eukprot:OHT10760.1 hypothetical protein TRFO_19897 [Tritrichomonas foetus]